MSEEKVMLNLLSVFIGGGIGSVLRWLCCTFIPSHWGTFCVNVAGAFLIGLAFAYFEKNSTLPPQIKMFAITGLLGGFTTFSTYLLNFTTLVNENNIAEAVLYLLGSVIIGCIFLLLGIKVFKLFA